MEGNRVRIADGVEWPTEPSVSTEPGQSVLVTVRPEALALTDEGGLEGVVRERHYVGARAFFTAETALGIVEFEASIHAADIGDVVRLDARTSRTFPDDGDA